MTHMEAIMRMKKEWIGKQVRYEGEVFTVVDVDTNYSLMIDKSSRFAETTAVGANMVELLNEEKKR